MKRTIFALVALHLSISTTSAQQAFRFNQLVLKEPHVFTQITLLGCTDITNNVPFNLAPSFNETLEESVTLDTDGDGVLDLSPILYFFGEGTATGMGPDFNENNVNFEEGGELAFHTGTCFAPLSSTFCDANPNRDVFRTDYDVATSGFCLTAIPGSTRPYQPFVTFPDGPCFVSDPMDISLPLAGLDVVLRDSRIAARFVGDPATDLVKGVIRGFLRQSDAAAIIVPSETPVIGGQPLSALLPGGGGNCSSQDDKDLGEDGSVGWWVYLNFEAAEVPFDAATSVIGVTPPPATEGLWLSRATPNPTRGEAWISYAVPNDVRADLAVHDVTGRRVATLRSDVRASGSLRWNLRDERGARVSSGVYFVRLEAGGSAMTTKLVVAD